MHDKNVGKYKQDRKSVSSRICSILCPCFCNDYSEESLSEKNSNYHQETKSNIVGNIDGGVNILNDLKKDGNLTLESFRVQSGKREKQRNPIVLKSLTQVCNKFEGEHVIKSTVKIWHSYPVYRHKQDQIFVLGNNKGYVLAKISTVRTEASGLAKKSFLNSKSSNNSSGIYGQTNLDKYWNKRYYMFEKFDEGIKINEQCWPMIIPQAVSEYISSKIKCGVVLDLFCGVGGNSIKLANTCQKVFVYDFNQESLKCLYNNSQVCSSENIEILNGFFDGGLDSQFDVILVSNYMRIEQVLKQKSISVDDFVPDLKKVLREVIRKCKNVVLVLPGNVDIEQLGGLFGGLMIEQGVVSQSCSMKIEKIFFGERLRFLLVFYGDLVNKEIVINEELDWIYRYLRLNVINRGFWYKKLIKKVRSIYGMMRLLNIVLECGIENEQNIFDRFCKFIRENKIIGQIELQRIIGQNDGQRNRMNFEEEFTQKPNMYENGFEIEKQDFEIQRTNSFFSSIVEEQKNMKDSNNEILGNKQIEIQIVDGSQCKQTSIFGQRSTYTPKSVNFNNFVNISGRNSVGMRKVEEQFRDSDVVEFMQLNMK